MDERNKMSTGKKLFAGLGVALGVIAGLVVIVGAVTFMGLGIIRSKGSGSGIHSDGFDRYYDYYNGYDDDYDSFYDYGYEDGYGEYVPDEDDEFYQEITDATSQECSYQIIWRSESMYADDSDDQHSFDCVYPVLTGENEAKLDAINSQIVKLATVYEGSYQDYTRGATSIGYVTYMDEEKFSVVFEHSLCGEEGDVPRLGAASFDMKTGRMISHREMAELDMELVKQFRAQNAYQNGEVEFVTKATDEELLALFRDEKESIMFYTPVGLEMGFNYSGESTGWVTVTLRKTIL